MPTYRFKQVDVFTSRPFQGNPVAVVLSAEEIDPALMGRIAAWTNLSETTFLLPPSSPQAHYRLRIFSPAGELPFAGHPTIGSAHAALESGIVPVGTRAFRQECPAGVLPLTVEGDGPQRRIFVRVPWAKVVGEHPEASGPLAAALGLALAAGPAPMTVDVGPIWLVGWLEDAEALARLRPDMTALARLSRELDSVGVTLFALAEGEEAVRVRSFAPAIGVPEDPVCGSGNAALAAYLARSGLLRWVGEEYVASQGREIGRQGQVLVRVRENARSIEIGGCAVTVIEGEIAW